MSALPPHDEQNDSAAKFCADLVRERDFARYATTLFVPADKRRALLALYAFNVEIAGVREHISQPLPGEIRLQWWGDLLAGGGHGGVSGNPVAAELMLTAAFYDLPIEQLARLVEAHNFDVYDDPMPTLEALQTYCFDTSSTLFTLAARILGGESVETSHAAHHAGIARGIADIIATLPLHASRGQIYLPRAMLDEHGVSDTDVFGGVTTPALREVVERLRTEGLAHLDAASELLAGVPESALPAFLELALIRRALAYPQRPEADVFKPVVPSRLAILWTLWRAARAKPFRN